MTEDELKAIEAYAIANDYPYDGPFGRQANTDVLALVAEVRRLNKINEDVKALEKKIRDEAFERLAALRNFDSWSD